MGIHEPAVSKFVLQAAGLIRVILARECRCRRRSRGDECVVSASGNMLIKAARGEPRARSDCFIPREGRERGERGGGREVRNEIAEEETFVRSRKHKSSR
jgi:hypothetical protein